MREVGRCWDGMALVETNLNLPLNLKRTLLSVYDGQYLFSTVAPDL